MCREKLKAVVRLYPRKGKSSWYHRFLPRESFVWYQYMGLYRVVEQIGYDPLLSLLVLCSSTRDKQEAAPSLKPPFFRYDFAAGAVHDLEASRCPKRPVHGSQTLFFVPVWKIVCSKGINFTLLQKFEAEWEEYRRTQGEIEDCAEEALVEISEVANGDLLFDLKPAERMILVTSMRLWHPIEPSWRLPIKGERLHSLLMRGSWLEYIATWLCERTSWSRKWMI